MNREEYLKNITNLENKLKRLQSEFAKLNIGGQEYARIEILLEHLAGLRNVVSTEFYRDIASDILQSDLDYFEANVKGLGIVLEAVRGHKNGTP